MLESRIKQLENKLEETEKKERELEMEVSQLKSKPPGSRSTKLQRIPDHLRPVHARHLFKRI
jgi:cell division protein FtsB